MKKRLADDVKNREDVIEVQQKMLSVENAEFQGDLFLNDFIKSKGKYLPKDNLCIRADHYKWLQFYDYHARVCLTTIYNAENEIVEWYFDIARKIGKENGIPYEEDLYLDVVVSAEGEISLLDEDELQEAFERCEITKSEQDEAYQIAEALMERVRGNVNKLKEFTDGYLRIMLGKE